MEKDEFIPNNHNKRDSLAQKVIRKQNLRKINSKKNLKESDSESGYQGQAIKEGARWWLKQDRRYFRLLNENDYSTIRSKLSGDNLLKLCECSNEIGPYILHLLASTPQLLDPTYLRVLFRRQHKITEQEQLTLMLYKFYQNTSIKLLATIEDMKQIDSNLHIYSFQNVPRKAPTDQQKIGAISMENYKAIKDQELIKQYIKNQFIKKQIPKEIDREINYWHHELSLLTCKNQQEWQMLQDNISVQVKESYSANQVQQIQQMLNWNHILLCFKLGHSDKTQAMLEDATELMMIKEMSKKESQRKKRGTKQEKLRFAFQTDCKICFCTESDDKNKVLYCDSCNTSFHQCCYGVRDCNTPNFYCEVCIFLSEQKNKKLCILNPLEGTLQSTGIPGFKIRKPCCQICSKANFPMKVLNEHFYHVTCLFLFNFACAENYCIQIQPSLTFESIQALVIENELGCGPCEFCGKKVGMKYQCSFQNCSRAYHPICGYLMGAKFQIQRSFRSLEVHIFCNDHFPGRDYVNQAYLRRFFCDYKGTSSLNEDDFKKLFMEENRRKQIKDKEFNPILRRVKCVNIRARQGNKPKTKEKDAQKERDNKESQRQNQNERDNEGPELAQQQQHLKTTMETQTGKLMKKLI